MPDSDLLDCLIIGAGPAGLTAALYLARFKRRFTIVDSGSARAAWIPISHNIPTFAHGIGGPDILARQRANIEQYGVRVQDGLVTALNKHSDRFVAAIAANGRSIAARRVLLATGAVDIEPDLPNVPNAVQRGLVRYCPICDGFEVSGKRIAVISRGERGLGEAMFIARTYSTDVTLLTLGHELQLDPAQRRSLGEHRIKIIEQPIGELQVEDGKIAALRTGDGKEYQFDALYSALGLKCRSGLAIALGAAHDASGALEVDPHNQTTIRGLYAAGDIVRGLDQIVVGMGHAATAATHIHNHCELPTGAEPEQTGHAQSN